MKKKIISDLGGCLFFCNFEYIAKHLAIVSSFSEKRILNVISGKDYRDYEKGLISSKMFYEKIKSKIEFTGSFELFQKIWSGQMFAVNKEYVKMLIDLMKDGYKLYCLSNINKLHWEVIIENFAEIELFHECFLSYKMKKIKPEIEIYQEVISRIGGKAKDFVFIDDRKENVKGAETAGMNALVYKHKNHNEFFNALLAILSRAN